MADGNDCITSDAHDGEINGCDVKTVRQLVSMFTRMASGLLRAEVATGSEMGSAFATACGAVVTACYDDIESARKLMQAVIDQLPDNYACRDAFSNEAQAEREVPYVVVPGTRTIQ